MKTRYQSRTQLQAHFEPRTQLRDYFPEKSQVQRQNQERLSDGYERGIKIDYDVKLSMDNNKFVFTSIVYHPGNYAVRRFKEKTGLPEKIIVLTQEIKLYDVAIREIGIFKRLLEREIGNFERLLEREREARLEEGRNLILKFRGED